MLGAVKNFLFEKFWLPVIDESVYYNPYNTVVLALLFGITILYVVRPAIRELDIKVDRRFLVGFTPFIIFGGILRTLKDADALNTIILETPFIYLLLFGVGAMALYACIKLEDRIHISYHKLLGLTGVILSSAAMTFLKLKEPLALFLFLSITLVWSTIGYLILRYKKPDLFSWEFSIPVSAHFLDATSTFTALSFGAEEKHVLGRIFIDLFGNGGLFVLKSLVIIPVVIYIIKNFEGEEKVFYLFIITLLGLGIATRNIFQTLALS